MSAPSMAEKIKQIYAAQRDAQEAHQKLAGILSNGPASFYFDKMGEYIEGLLSFSKFKIGDTVVLVKDYDTSRSPGWEGCKHFLKAGRKAIVRDLDYGNGAFRYGVEFVNETYIHPMNGKELPVSSKHEFWFSETDLA